MNRKQFIEAVKVKLEEISPFEEPDSFVADTDDEGSTVKPIITYIDESLDEAAHNCLKSLPLTLLHADIERSNPTLAIASDGVATFDISPENRFVRFRHPDLKRDITAFISTEDPMYLVQQNKWTRGGLAKPVAVVAANHDGTSAGKMEIYTLTSNSSTSDGYLLSIRTNKHADDRNSRAYVVYNGKKHYYVAVVMTDWDYWRSDDGDNIFTSTDATGNTRSVYTGPNGSAAAGSSTTSYVAAVTDNDNVKSPIEEYIVLECAAMVANIIGDANTAQILKAQFQEKLQAQLQ